MLIVDDPSGNSYVENPHPLHSDAQQIIVHYTRTLDQEKLLALVPDDATEMPSQDSRCVSLVFLLWSVLIYSSSVHTTAYDLDEKANDDAKKEVLHFEQPCPQCHSSSELCMKVVNIPHFKGLSFALFRRQ